MKLKNKRRLKFGLGVSITSTIVGVLAYYAGKESKINNSNYEDSLFDKIEDGVEHVIYTFKKEQ